MEAYTRRGLREATKAVSGKSPGGSRRKEPKNKASGTTQNATLEAATDGDDPQPLARRSRRTRSTAERRAIAPMPRRRSREGRRDILYVWTDRYSALTGSGAIRPQRNAGGWRVTSAQHAGPGGRDVHIGVDRWFPSPRRCSAYHAVHAGLTLADRHWRSAACAAEHDHDVNAARNLEQQGLRLLTGQRPAGPGRSMRAEGHTPGLLPARSGSGPVTDEAPTDPTGPRRSGTAEARARDRLQPLLGSGACHEHPTAVHSLGSDGNGA